MKFDVGDRVRVVVDSGFAGSMRGQVGTVTQVEELSDPRINRASVVYVVYYVWLDGDEQVLWWFYPQELAHTVSHLVATKGDMSAEC